MTPRPATHAEVVAAVAALAPGQRFVGIDGFGASGKTSLAHAIAAEVARAVIVHLDDLQGPRVAEWDWDRLQRDVIGPLRAGRPARYDLWSWGETTASGTGTVASGSVAIIEGVSATRSEAAVPWDLTVWVETAEDVRRRRTTLRDGPDYEEIWREFWIPAELAYAERERPWERVDFLIDGTYGTDGTDGV